MRRHILAALFLFAGIMAKAQMVQYGKVVEMNSHGKKLSGVSITIPSAHDCQPTSSDSYGTFRLCFGEHQTGDVVVGIRAQKYGYEVVNLHVTRDGWTLTTKDSLKIVMAPTEKLMEARLKYYDLIETACISRFDETNAFLREQYVNGHLSSDEYEYWLAAAQSELQRAYGEMEDLANSFACINTDDMDEVSGQVYQKLAEEDVRGAMALVAGDSFSTVMQAYNDLNAIQPMENPEQMVAGMDSIVAAETVSADMTVLQSYVGMMERDYVTSGAKYAKACAYLGVLYKDIDNMDLSTRYLKKALAMYELLNAMGESYGSQVEKIEGLLK